MDPCGMEPDEGHGVRSSGAAKVEPTVEGLRRYVRDVRDESRTSSGLLESRDPHRSSLGC